MMLRKGDEIIPGYRLEQFLGKGQFGEVWRTTAPGRTRAALKIIDLSGKQGLKEWRGVQRVKEIRHAHLMPITALWLLDSDGEVLGDDALESLSAPSSRATMAAPAAPPPTATPHCLVVAMLLADKSLMNRLEEHQAQGHEGIPLDELLRYMEEAAKGIDFLNSPQHDLGEGLVAIQHCDIKPDNIMLVGDSVVVCDFGLARMLSDVQLAVTGTGMAGSPAYMPPECIQGQQPSHTSDQYSLAISYVELRTGRLPFPTDSYLGVLDCHTRGRLDLSNLTPAEQTVIRRATSLDPAARFPTSLAMVQALRRAVEAQPPAGRHRMRTASLALAAASIMAVAAWAWMTGEPPPVEPPPVRPPTIGQNGNADAATSTASTNSPDTSDQRASDSKQGSSNQAALVNARQLRSLIVHPPGLRIRVDEKEHVADADGAIQVPLLPGTPLRIQIAPPDPSYLGLDRTFTFDQLKQQDFRVQLERSPQYLVDQALEQWISGNRDAAVETYQQAIRRDQRFASVQPVLLERHDQPLQAIGFTPDSSRLFTTGDDARICLWKPSAAETDAAPATILSGHEREVECGAVSADGRWLVTGSWDDTAIAWDLQAEDPAASGRVLRGHGDDVLALAITPDSRRVATASADGTIRLWTLGAAGSEQMPQVLRGHKDQVSQLMVSADGRWLVSISLDGNVLRWQLTADDVEATAQPLLSPLQTARMGALTPDSQRAILAQESGMLLVAELTTPGSAVEMAGHDDAVEALAISGDGELLATAGADHQVQLRRLADLSAPPRIFTGHSAAVVALAFSPDGRWLASASWDKTVRLWPLEQDDAAAKPLVLAGHQGRVEHVAVSADGRWLATAGHDQTARLWHLPRCELVYSARRALGLDSPTIIEARRHAFPMAPRVVANGRMSFGVELRAIGSRRFFEPLVQQKHVFWQKDQGQEDGSSLRSDVERADAEPISRRGADTANWQHG